MDFNHLTDEEISYELALRHIVNVASMTHRNKVLKLKALTQEEVLRDIAHSSSNQAIDPDVNIESCSHGVQQLQSLVALAQKPGSSQDLSIITSRLTHYKNRLAIVDPPEHLVPALQSLRQIVENLLVNVNSAVTKLVNQQPDRVNSGAGAIPKGQRQQVTATSQRSPSRTTGDKEGELSFHNSLRMSEEESRKFGLPLSSSPLNTSRGRGRGTSLSLPESARQNIAMDEANRNRYAAGINREEPQYDRPSHNERQYNQLRDDLLNRLIQVQLQQQQGNGRMDDRRMQKAIHNWPFKFRGERDTKALNTFLDRVEAFARSEGVSDEVLLTSIKHLLQEDALDWYARAEYQGLLTSWASFKQQIRKEYLPAQYGQLLRAEAFFRYQGHNEPFAKYFRDITALFRFAEPQMTEDEKLFIVKKNMHADYAIILTAAKPATLTDLVDICSSYDDTRMLLNRQQRKMGIHQESLIEPNLATPTSGQRSLQHNHSSQRYNRVHAVEFEDSEYHSSTVTDKHHLTEQKEERAEDDWTMKLDQLMEQVNALKMQVDRRFSRIPGEQTNNSERKNVTDSQQRDSWRPLQHNPQQPLRVERQSPATNDTGSQQQLQHRNLRHYQSGQEDQFLDNGRPRTICWNCEEEGHRFSDCRKQQTFLFCHTCGRRGCTLRNCLTCRTAAGNSQAGIQ